MNGTGQLRRSLQEARQLFHSTPTTSSAPGAGLLKPHPKAQGLRIELWFLTILTAQSLAQSEGTTVANSPESLKTLSRHQPEDAATRPLEEAVTQAFSGGPGPDQEGWWGCPLGSFFGRGCECPQQLFQHPGW